MTRAVAKLVIQLAKQGERDPGGEGAVKALGKQTCSGRRTAWANELLGPVRFKLTARRERKTTIWIWRNGAWRSRAWSPMRRRGPRCTRWRRRGCAWRKDKMTKNRGVVVRRTA